MKLKIYHTNDIHSHLHHYVRISRYLQHVRPTLTHPSLYVDLGDHVDLSAPITEGTMGKRNITLMNEAGVDVATIGNNEGMTISHEALNALYDDATFTVTCSNLFDLETGVLPNRFVQSHIRHIDGVRCLFIGVTAPFTPFYSALNWRVTDPFEAIQHEIEANNGQYDVLIILSHVGIFFDERLCDEMPEIDIIFGSHTHHHFEDGMMRNGVLMAAAGKYGYYLGEVDLEIIDGNVVSKHARLHTLASMPEVETHFEAEGRQCLDQCIIQRPVTLSRAMDRITQATHMLAESIHDFTQAECTLINAGLLVKGVNNAPVTAFDIHQMLPHPINTVTIQIPGFILKQVIIESQKQAYMHERAQGLGFRGNIFGGYILYGMGYIASQQRYFVQGEEIDDERIYTLGTVDMYTFGRYFPMLKDLPTTYLMPEFLRDIYQSKLLISTF